MWLFWENFWLQIWHEKGFSPVWVLMWVSMLPFWENFRPQIWHGKGFSPVWILMWTFSPLFCKKFRPQFWHEKGFSPVWILIWIFMWPFWEIFFLQIWQVYCFSSVSLLWSLLHWKVFAQILLGTLFSLGLQPMCVTIWRSMLLFRRKPMSQKLQMNFLLLVVWHFGLAAVCLVSEASSFMSSNLMVDLLSLHAEVCSSSSTLIQAIPGIRSAQSERYTQWEKHKHTDV